MSTSALMQLSALTTVPSCRHVECSKCLLSEDPIQVDLGWNLMRCLLCACSAVRSPVAMTAGMCLAVMLQPKDGKSACLPLSSPCRL